MPNSVIIGPSKPQTLVNGGISRAYMAWFPAQETNAASMPDRSGKGLFALFNAGLTPTEAWTTDAGWFSALETTSQDDAYIDVSNWSYSFNDADSLFISWKMKMAVPAASRSIFSQGYSSADSQGIRLYVKNTGVLAPLIYQTGGDKFLSDTASVVADGTEKTVAFAMFDHNRTTAIAKYMVWINGERAYNTEVTATALTAVTPVANMRIGGAQTGAASFQSAAVSLRDIHILRTPNAKSWTYLQMDAIARRLHRTPFVPLTEAEFPSA